MFFEDRPINIAKVESMEHLAKQLCNMWTLCTGFELPVQGNSGALFINDMTSEDGAQEYAITTTMPGIDSVPRIIKNVINRSYKIEVVQFESITFSTNERQNLDLIKNTVHIIPGKEPRPYERLVPVNTHPADSCYLCQ